MRILMVCARYLPLTGGTEQHVHEVGRRMAARGHHVTVLTTDRDGSMPAREQREGMHIIRCAAGPTRSDLYWSPDIWREISRADCDLIHVQGWHTLVAPLAMAAAVRRRMPFALTFHSGGHSSPSRQAVRGLQARLLRPLATRARQLIGVSRFEADHFSQALNIARERFQVIRQRRTDADTGRAHRRVGRRHATDPVGRPAGTLQGPPPRGGGAAAGAGQGAAGPPAHRGRRSLRSGTARAGRAAGPGRRGRDRAAFRRASGTRWPMPWRAPRW